MHRIIPPFIREDRLCVSVCLQYSTFFLDERGSNRQQSARIVVSLFLFEATIPRTLRYGASSVHRVNDKPQPEDGCLMANAVKRR